MPNTRSSVVHGPPRRKGRGAGREDGGTLDPAGGGLLRALRAALDAGPPVALDGETRARARAHGLLAVLAARVATDQDEAGRRELQAERLQAVAAAARARAELHEVVATLARAGVRAVAIKGPALAARTGLLRPGNDLDLLVAPRALGRAERALRALGLAADPGDPPACGLVGERVLLAPGRLPVDLHGALVKPLLRPRCPRPRGAELERVVLAPGEPPLAALGPAWTLALATVHLHHDGLSLRRLVDLAALLRRLPPVDLARGHAVARRLGLSGVLRWAADLAHAWLGAPLPAWAAGPATLAQRVLLPRLSDPSRWTAATPGWLDGRAPGGDEAGLRRVLLRLALEDDALRVLPDRLARLLAPPAAYARWRGHGPGRSLGLLARALRAV